MDKLKHLFTLLSRSYSQINLFDNFIYFKVNDVNCEIYDYDNVSIYSDSKDWSKDFALKINPEINPELFVSTINTFISDITDSAGFFDVVSVNNDKFDFFGWTAQGYYSKIVLSINSTRPIQIDSFGMNHKLFKEFCSQYDGTFSVLHIGIKRPQGVNLRLLRGTSPIIQELVENASGYLHFIIVFKQI
jgi:hypothetical protein